MINLGGEPLAWPEDVNQGRPGLELCPACLAVLTAVLRNPDFKPGVTDGELAKSLDRFTAWLRGQTDAPGDKNLDV